MSSTHSQAQTPQQRRANLKFARDQEARRGKSSEELKKKNKEVPKSPISPVWLGMSINQKKPPPLPPLLPLGGEGGGVSSPLP